MYIYGIQTASHSLGESFFYEGIDNIRSCTHLSRSSLSRRRQDTPHLVPSRPLNLLDRRRPAPIQIPLGLYLAHKSSDTTVNRFHPPFPPNPPFTSPHRILPVVFCHTQHVTKRLMLDTRPFFLEFLDGCVTMMTSRCGARRCFEEIGNLTKELRLAQDLPKAVQSYRPSKSESAQGT